MPSAADAALLMITFYPDFLKKGAGEQDKIMVQALDVADRFCVLAEAREDARKAAHAEKRIEELNVLMKHPCHCGTLEQQPCGVKGCECDPTAPTNPQFSTDRSKRHPTYTSGRRRSQGDDSNG